MALNDYLHILSDKTWAGENRIDWRVAWYALDAVEQVGVFTLPGGATVRGEWVAEGGDASLPPAKREPRILAKKGKLVLAFTGTNISVRVGLNPNWGVGQVYIDGKKPSLIAGLSTAMDSFSCDSNAHSSWGNEYVDITLADGLTDGAHTLEVYCNNLTAGAGGFVVVTGFKVYSQSRVSRDVRVWVESRIDMAQAETMEVINPSTKTIRDVRLRFPPGLVSSTGAAMPEVILGDIAARGSKSVVLVPDLSGTESIGVTDWPIELQAKYEAGGLPSGNFVPQQAGLVYTGSWSNDSDFGELREYSGTKGASIAFTVEAAEFTLRVQRDYGWGSFLVLVSPLVSANCAVTSASRDVTVPAALISQLAVGMYVTGTSIPEVSTITAIDAATNRITISANATATNANRTLTFETLLTSITSNDGAGGGFFVDVPVSGLPAPSGNKVRLVAMDAKPAVWSRLSWAGSGNYDTVLETLHYRATRQHVPPFPIEGARLENGQLAWSSRIPDRVDLSVPLDSRGLDREEVGVRFPTFIVIYQPGYQDIVKEYDIAVLDPFALTRKQVKELQALGIKVLVYVSFGEEDSTLADVWDPNSAQVPWVGDGKGPGSYASYYMKGGYGYGEMSECTHDCQRVDGSKRCAVGNAKYNPNWTGRCSAACSKDWREGYKAWEEGGKCGGGYTSANFWQRDASKACTNGGCPKYTPSNTKCPQYEQAEVWGQDFSISANFPDENGIWASYYVDAVGRGPDSWYARIRDYYLPLIFSEPQPRHEVLPVVKKVLDPQDLETGTVYGIALAHAPVDEDEPLSIIHEATGYAYERGLEWDMDFKLGVVKLHPNEGSPATPEGTLISVFYATKGLGADGVFMDTVDTVDVYPDEAYQKGAADLINDMKALYPGKAFCSNRGFSILDRIIHSCSYVMFETFLTEYDWEQKTYFKLSAESEAWNDEITEQLFRLRRQHVFDVIGLNYCSNGPEGDELRKYIREETNKRGWLSWSSEILLNRPLHNSPFTDLQGPIRSNTWRTYRVKRK